MTGTLNLPSDGLAAGTDQFVLADDKIGIGKTDPDSTLDVGGSGHFSTNLKVDGQLNMGGNIALGSNYLSNDGTNKGITINDDGYVWIGDQTPDWSSTGGLIIGTSNSNALFLGAGSKKIRWAGGVSRSATESYFANGKFNWSGYNGSVYHIFTINGGTGRVGLMDDNPDSARFVIADDSPWALVLGDKASTPWSAIKVGDASFTTSSDSTKKRNIKRKIAKGDTTVLSRLLDMPEASWYWDGAKVKREKFNPERHWHGEAEWDSLSVTKRDSIRSAWIARREERIAKIAERKRFGPMAQDVADALGPEAGDGESINWDRVNSEYRRAMQELIIIVRQQQEQIDKQQEQIDDLKKRVKLLEKQR